MLKVDEQALENDSEMKTGKSSMKKEMQDVFLEDSSKNENYVDQNIPT